MSDKEIEKILREYGRYMTSGRGSGYNSRIEAVQDVIDELRENNDQYAELIRLHYELGYTYDKIADILYCDISTLFRRKNKIVEKIRRKLNG